MSDPVSSPLVDALQMMLGKLDAALRRNLANAAIQEPIRMYLAGGMAAHLHCGIRSTEDVDASFSMRLLLRAEELTVEYLLPDGSPAQLYFDANYNDTFALMHPDYRERAIPWSDIGNEGRMIHLYVLTPLDLVVSKLSRYSASDRADIRSLIALRTFTEADLRNHVREALGYYVGGTDWLLFNLEQVCEENFGETPDGDGPR